MFVDSEAESWNLDPAILQELLTKMAQTVQLPAAIVTVDLFGDRRLPTDAKIVIGSTRKASD